MSGLGLVSAMFGAVAVALVAAGAPRDQVDRAVLEALIVGVPVGVGLYAARSPRDRRFGVMLVGAGLIWSLTALAESSNSLMYSVGRVVAWLIFPLLMYLMLAFPKGRLAPGVDRILFGGITLLIALLYIGSALFIQAYPPHTPWASCNVDCPRNAFLVLDAQPAVMEDVVTPIRELLAVVLLAGVAVSLASRTRAATALQRRASAPVLLMSIVSVAVLIAYLVTRRIALDSDAVGTLGRLWALCLPGIAAAFFVGLLRRRLRFGEVLGRLSVALNGELDRGRLRVALATALNDPTVDVLLPTDGAGRWRNSDGDITSTSQAAGSGRATTPIHVQGATDALLVHDRALRDDDELLAAVTSLASSSLQHHRLVERLASSVSQLEESRKRIAQAADVERSRIERDLHDGAQQRLIGLRIRLSLAEELLRTDPVSGADAVHELDAQIELALDELRSLAHGIYPSLLSDRGLKDALRSVAMQSPVPVHLQARGVTRHPAEIETAVYFACREAIQNAVKHAHGATGLWVSLRQDGVLTAEVRDDGPGFTPRRGGDGGLRNMRDRVEAVGGQLTIDASPGHGTRIVFTIPLTDRSDRGRTRRLVAPVNASDGRYVPPSAPLQSSEMPWRSFSTAGTWSLTLSPSNSAPNAEK